MPPRRMKKRVYRKRKVVRKSKISRGLAGVPEVASLTEIISNRATQGVGFYAGAVSYRLTNMSLALCPRAVQVAQAYQDYRIKRITLAFKPLFDTFTAGSPNVSVPYLYYMVDKRLAVPFNFTIDTLKSMGATPKRFDDKTIVAKYAPAVLQSSITDPGSLTTALAVANISPWLPTSNAPSSIGTYIPSDVDHTGIVWQLYQAGSVPVMYYDIDIMVDFEFRKPRLNGPTDPPPGGFKNLQWNESVDAPVV